jgi:ABC-type lipoprotein release transport system permease subunit
MSGETKEGKPMTRTIPGVLGLRATVRLGWRNLKRNRRRTWITASTVALAVLLLQFSAALLIGVEQQSFDNLINYQTGHAKVYADGYFELRDELPLDHALPDSGELLARIKAVSGVAAATPRLTFQAQLSNGMDQIPCLGVGIQVRGSDTDVFRIPQTVVDGEYLTEGEDGILLGSGIAEIFEVSAGDWLTVLAKTQYGAYEALDLPIKGVIGTGNPLIDRNSFLLPLPTAQYILDMDGSATEVAVRFSATARESATLRRLEDAIEPSGAFDVKGWREMEQDFMALVQAKRMGQAIMLGIFMLLAVVGITNTILMAAYERTREIGMLMAIGLRGTGIRRLFLTEGAFTGLLGGAVGSLIAVGLIAWLASVGINFNALFGDIDIGYPVRDAIYPALSPFLVAFGWLVTGVLAALAALYPAARASHQRPVEALRHV